MKPLLVTMGDAAGIGPEIVVRAFERGALHDAVVIGDVGVLRRAGAPMTAVVEAPADLAAVPPGCLPVLVPPGLPPGLDARPWGRVDARCGAAAACCIEHAVALARAGDAAAIVTAPIHKEALAAALFADSGAATPRMFPFPKLSESRPVFTTDRPPFNRSCFLVETTNQVPRALPRLEQIESLVRANRDAHDALGREFERLWRADCKPYALDWTVKRYAATVQWYDGVLAQLAAARQAAQEGQPLPPPEQVGLALPDRVTRRHRPHRTETAPLDAAAPWADAQATHRLGLVVKAGAVSRAELPVQLDVVLPAEVASRSVRAFCTVGGGQADEILAQLDPSENQAKARLTLHSSEIALAKLKEPATAAELASAQANLETAKEALAQAGQALSQSENADLQAAGAALLTDYILTVAVSISSGVAQITSAYPVLYPYRVEIAAGLVLFVMLINLRGVKESGAAFAIPTYYFVIAMFATVCIGLVRWTTGSLGLVTSPPELEIPLTVQVITPFLLLHALANGTSALTGIEAISNGITAFKEPRSRNAGITLIWMSSILGTLFLSITLLANRVGAVPSEVETVISQIARTVLGGNYIAYLGVIAGTALILVLAANTAFADFPRLGALAAADGYLPRQLTYRGSRLVYSRGIAALAVIAIALIVVFQASVTRLIPLYAIGVFLSFTLSQTGMARRWWKSGQLKPETQIVEPGSILKYDPKWIIKMIINSFGALCTVVVMFVFAITKFADGAWIVLIVTPALVYVFYHIHRHYRSLAGKLSLENYGVPPAVDRLRIILPLSGVHRGTLAALRYALSLSNDVTAVHVSMDAEEAARLQAKWTEWGEGVRLVILDSPYRLMAEPLLEYIEEICQQRQPNETITIVVPQFVPRHWYHNLLHTNTAFMLRMALLFKPGIVITDVPYQVD